ncbi:mechanosensitive ion channel family protein [Roseibium denhamense]|uniref:Small-conductance mechanosensitive channel n=1 Tax=Roseibium denhamense TaxID=76305 RepID=A0ABY1N725_9HYPH|nr:mechanosensitive ion channel family protein [Roseibium denhamense]MTI06041.1 mechanosensitive ion channel family protein [Roseibium denhamense]SMP01780.1 Small-conductance mechanosensitive channel [Roseibium denhamense]
MKFSKCTDERSGVRYFLPTLFFFAFSLVIAGFITLPVTASEAQAQGISSVVSTITSDAGKTTESEAAPAPADSAKVSSNEGTEEGAGFLEALDSFGDEAVEARDVLKGILSEIPTIHDSVLQTLQNEGEEAGLAWISAAVFDVSIGVALGLFAAFLLARWGRKQFAHMYKQDVYSRSDKIIYLYLRALLMIAGVALFFITGAVVYLAIGSGLEAANETAMVVLGMIAAFLTLRIIWLNLLAPDAESHRLVELSNEEASGLYRSLLAGGAVSLTAFAFCLLMERLGLPQDVHKVALIGASALSMVILSVIAVVYRTTIARLIRGRELETAPLWRRVLANVWHFIAIIYFVVAWSISSIRILLDMPDATGLVAAPLEVLLLAAVVYGLLILLIDKLLLPRLDTPKAQAQIAEDIERAEDSEGEVQDRDSLLSQARAEAAEREEQRSPFRQLLDRGAAIVVGFGAIDLLANWWGVPLAGSGSLIGSFIEVILVVFLGYMAYEAVKILIDRQIEKEAPAEKDEEAEVGGAGESRIATLLPIFRNFLLITIVVIAAMVVLAELGVNIAPLFAGAGVVGLAIGFGAQTLIRDIFSGAFYLIDDAFRKGEYIDIGSAKGVVEKISIRSMQLRHHRGALTTVPFGEIQQVENFSRDWAVMKLAFRVTYDTDVEKMRKIIKNFGKELLDDEYYGPMFLAPLKSQGILSMEDSAMIARVKFTTKPGKQFELRKVVYAGLRDLFEKNGIKFAHRQVTVRVAGSDGDDDDQAPGAAARAAAAAGAAASGMIHDAEAGQADDGPNDQL